MGQIKANTVVAALCLATFITISAQMQPLNINTTGEPVTLTHVPPSSQRLMSLFSPTQPGTHIKYGNCRSRLGRSQRSP